MTRKESNRLYAPNRIRELREARDLSMEMLGSKVAEHLGREEEVSFSMVAKIETRMRALSLDYILAFAKALNVSPTEIFAEPEKTVRYAPILGKIAAGNWSEAVRDPRGWVPIPPDVAGPKAFALLPDGDSMDLIVGDHGYIIVDPDQIDLINRKYYAVANAVGETTFKMFSASPPMLMPCSSNKAHEPILIGREPFTTIGRVTFAGKML
ncbi:helix-turn-helix domain-containing protein [Sphingobium phenoxybenzoativorans]|uniref:Helix-turn-helix domain-containing protein n=1 Tax=Sphingobium phenoxybenzoativorans TaxID=1592790 RepID=A0A975K331_9SPHN|nr:LexA family transcriptional regulator [Sphingobium phenoxybenzoativorans]QUT04025.1 helix-turn-helix domain-containing protein [Sphingobium phenoxybenzoativorans]